MGSQSPRQCQCHCRRPLCQLLLPTHTIVPTASPIGLWDGLWARKSGAAGCMERAAQDRAPVALLPAPLLPPTIATQASPTGWPDGVRQRRIGAAGMLARAAHQQLEVVLESLVRLSERCTRGALAPAPSSGDTLNNVHPLAAQFALRRADI